MTDLSLFPDINPNIDEIIKQQNAVCPEEVATEPVPDKKKTHREIFLQSKTKKKLSKRDNEEMNSPTLTIIEEDLEANPSVPKKEMNKRTKQVKKGKYAHLAKAREKGLQKRREKAAAKKLEKMKAKELKELEKIKRREATKERNREKARERYRRLKAEKDVKTASTQEVKKEIFKESAPKNMSFKTFARYMNQYEKVKSAYEVHKDRVRSNTEKRNKVVKNVKVNKKVSKPIPIPQKYKPKFHPKNYPLAHLYNPANQSNNGYF